MVSPSRIRHLIAYMQVNEEESVSSKIYIDFVDRKKWARFYLLYSVRYRSFKAVKMDQTGVGRVDVSNRLRLYLISILPPHIIARCTAASLRFKDG